MCKFLFFNKTTLYLTNSLQEPIISFLLILPNGRKKDKIDMGF